MIVDGSLSCSYLAFVAMGRVKEVVSRVVGPLTSMHQTSSVIQISPKSA